MMCPECGSSRVTSAPGTLPVCRDCDWTGWQKNPPIDQARFEEGLLDTDEARLARGKTAAVAADQAATTDFLAAFAEAEEAARLALQEALQDPTHPCHSGHTWTFVRKYNGTEVYNVKMLIDQETGDEIDPASIAPDDARTFAVVCHPNAASDGYDGISEEYLECQYCPAVITAERVDGMDTTFD